MARRKMLQAGARQSPKTLAEKSREHDHHEGEHNKLITTRLAQEFGGHVNQEGACDRTRQRSEAADDDHADDKTRLRDEAHFRADKLSEMSVQRTCQSADGSAQCKGIGLPAHNSDTTAGRR